MKNTRLTAVAVTVGYQTWITLIIFRLTESLSQAYLFVLGHLNSLQWLTQSSPPDFQLKRKYPIFWLCFANVETKK